MTAVNSIIPAVLAGNSVILKHSPRTPLCGEHYEKTFAQAGFPKNVLQASFTDHDVAAEIIHRPETAFVSFTGSVNGYVALHCTKVGMIWTTLVNALSCFALQRTSGAADGGQALH
jgi:acyl-CoA reductase-like NAD-dependent aldehyde dehydrogenase